MDNEKLKSLAVILTNTFGEDGNAYYDDACQISGTSSVNPICDGVNCTDCPFYSRASFKELIDFLKEEAE